MERICTYDGAGNLVEMSCWDGAQVEIAAYVYNGANQIACLDGQLNQRDELQDRAYAHRRWGLDRVLDGVRRLVDPVGDVLLAQTYDPYGNLYASAGVNTYTYDTTMRLTSYLMGR